VTDPVLSIVDVFIHVLIPHHWWLIQFHLRRLMIRWLFVCGWQEDLSFEKYLTYSDIYWLICLPWLCLDPWCCVFIPCDDDIVQLIHWSPIVPGRGNALRLPIGSALSACDYWHCVVSVEGTAKKNNGISGVIIMYRLQYCHNNKQQ